MLGMALLATACAATRPSTAPRAPAPMPDGAAIDREVAQVMARTGA